MVCFMPWLGKLLTTDVFTTTLTSLQMMGEPGGIRIRGPTRGRCQAARTVSGVRAPTQARAHRPLSPLAPALLVRVFKFETCGFSRSSRAPPPPPPGLRGGRGRSRAPTNPVSEARGPPRGCGRALRARAAQARAGQDPRDCLSQEWGRSQCPVSRLPSQAETSSSERRAAAQVRLGGKRRAGRG